MAPVLRRLNIVPLAASYAPPQATAGNSRSQESASEQSIICGRTLSIASKKRGSSRLEGSGGTSTVLLKPSKSVERSKHRRRKPASQVERGSSVDATSPKKRKKLAHNDEELHSEGRSAEVARLKQEISRLHKEREVLRRDVASRTEAFENAKKELKALKKSSRKQATQMEKLKEKSKNSEDSLSVIEEQLQCQICLELLTRPYVLSPCGHVSCQACLQQWFRSALQQHYVNEFRITPLEYEMKHCPCCRTPVNARPIPLFVLRGILESLTPQAEDAPVDADPWHGIFPDPHEEDSDTEEYDTVEDDTEEENDDSTDEDEDDEDEDEYHSDSEFSQVEFVAQHLALGFNSDEDDSSSDTSDDASSHPESSVIVNEPVRPVNRVDTRRRR